MLLLLWDLLLLSKIKEGGKGVQTNQQCNITVLALMTSTSLLPLALLGTKQFPPPHEPCFISLRLFKPCQSQVVPAARFPFNKYPWICLLRAALGTKDNGDNNNSNKMLLSLYIINSTCHLHQKILWQVFTTYMCNFPPKTYFSQIEMLCIFT